MANDYDSAQGGCYEENRFYWLWVAFKHNDEGL